MTDLVKVVDYTSAVCCLGVSDSTRVLVRFPQLSLGIFSLVIGIYGRILVEVKKNEQEIPKIF